jgi:predicted nucleic acid-binding protein
MTFEEWYEKARRDADMDDPTTAEAIHWLDRFVAAGRAMRGFEEWLRSTYPGRPNLRDCNLMQKSWDASRKMALIEAAEAVQLAATRTLAPPLDTADCALVDAIRTAIRNL